MRLKDIVDGTDEITISCDIGSKMLACWCAGPGHNPIACRNCSMHWEYEAEVTANEGYNGN